MNNEALIRQLAEAHAEHQKYEARIAKLQVETGKRIRDVQHDMGLRIKNLEEELGQCRKRETAVRDVVVQVFEEEKGLSTKAKEIEERERKVKEEEYRVETEKKKVASERREVEIAKDELEASALTSQNISANRQESHKIDPYCRSFWTPSTKRSFYVVDRAKFETYQLPVSFEDMNKMTIQQLRRNDYYKGWLDATKTAGQQRDVEQGVTPASGVPHLEDVLHPKNPKNAGLNAGALFAYAALCQDHNRPDLGVRLDDRRFSLKALTIPKLHEKELFWLGYAEGENYAQECFWRNVTVSEADDGK